MLDPPETMASQAARDPMDNRVDLEKMQGQRTSFHLPLTNAHVPPQLDLEARKDPLDPQEIMGNLEDRDPTGNQEQLDRQDPLVQMEATEPLDQKDLLETMANKARGLLDPKDPLAHQARLDLRDQTETLAPTVNPADLEHLASQATKEPLAILEDLAKMAAQEDPETQDPQARARNALRLGWLLAISQLMTSRTVIRHPSL